MDGKIGENAQLDCAIFQILSAQNRYESVIFSKGMAEKLASGSLDHLAMHLSEAKRVQSSSSNGTFKLQLAENLKGSSWFTKSTLLSFLSIISSPEMLESANQLLNEMSQLEETRKFHLALYIKQNHLESGSTGGLVDNIGVGQQVNVDAILSDDTKNELLRALDLRLMALKEEMMVLLTQSARSNLSTKDISDLSAFVQHFGAIDFRSSLLKYFVVLSSNQPSEASNEPTLVSQDTRGEYENALSTPQLDPQADILKHVNNSVSPVKLAQVERQSSTESEESSESSDEDQAVIERSRPAIRMASPRRSASPMRRVQIGRSGSRRPTSISIKSISYFPARERISAEENSSFGDEPDQQSKKPESTVRSMSVQDAINLFESKQKDQNLDMQTKRFAGIGGTNKSVLRRWSAGMGDSFKHQSKEDYSDTITHNNSINLAEAEKNLVEVKVDSDVPASSLCEEVSSAIETTKSSPTSTGTELVKLEHEETIDRAAASAEWNRQKEAELNQMLLKMMESKPGAEDAPNEQKEGSYSQYKEKRDAKQRVDSVGKRIVKEAHLKARQSPEQSREKIASKSRGSMEKHISPVHPQKPRRNSSPPVLPKKEASKMPASKKVLPNASPLPSRRSSWSSRQPSTTNSAHRIKGAAGTTLSTPPNRRKAQTQPNPSAEKPIQQQKTKKETLDDVKPATKRPEEKKLKPVTTVSRSAKAKDSPTLKGDSGSAAKPSFYSKVTKKSTVVPLESKTSMRKGTKRNASQPNAPSKDIGSPILAEVKESVPRSAEPVTEVLHADLAQPTDDLDAHLKISADDDLNIEKTENFSSCILDTSVELPDAGTQPDEDMGISSAAWVEVEEHEQVPTVCENDQKTEIISNEIAPVPSSSPRIRHSLSHMLQADSNGTEITGWGNAEIPPALVHQKDSPKGLKRLLKFARKSKAESNVSGWLSPSVFSEGEEDLDDSSNGANVKGSDLLSRKAATLQAKAQRHQRNAILSGSFDGGISSKRAFESRKMHGATSAQLSTDKLRDGHASVAAPSTKGTRSFFSLSTFRSSKSSDTRRL